MTTERDADALVDAVRRFLALHSDPDDWPCNGKCSPLEAMKAALRAQGDSASTHVPGCSLPATHKDCGFTPVIPGFRQRDSATTEGAVLDVDVLAKALAEVKWFGDTGPGDAASFRLAAEQLAFTYSRALRADVPDETEDVDGGAAYARGPRRRYYPASGTGAGESQ